MEYTKGQLKTMAAMRPPKRLIKCKHLITISRTIKAIDGSSESYIDTYFQCNVNTPIRITRKSCRRCINYKPVIVEKNESN